MKKVLILVNGLYIGGFSKSLINLLYCNNPDETGVQLSVLNLDKKNCELESDFPSGISVYHEPDMSIHISASGKLKQFCYKKKYAIVEYYYRFIKRKTVPGWIVKEYVQVKQSILADSIKFDTSKYKEFDVIVSWEEVFCNYSATRLFPEKICVGFVHPNYIEAGFSKKIDYPCFKRLKRIVSVSESGCLALKQTFPKLKNKMCFIPNTLNSKYYIQLSDKYKPDYDKSTKNILTVNRIDDKSKAVFRLVRIAELLHANSCKFKWYIIGDGHDYKELKSLIELKNLSDIIICLGAMANPYPYMKEADLYVQQSYYEGRPVSVDEAMLLGTPALITNYSSSREQVNDGVDGWIVENNEQSIYNKIKWLLDNPDEIDKARKNLRQKDFLQFEDCSAFINLINELPE